MGLQMENNHAVGFVRYLPNVFSLIRIFGTLLLPFLMWSNITFAISLPVLGELSSVPLVWIFVFVLLVFTDKVDGTLARRFNAESALGSILDVVGDALLLVVGVVCCITGFARASLTDFQFWFFLFLVFFLVAERILCFVATMKFIGKGNMLHSFPHKAFAASAYFLVVCWSFTSALPTLSILFLWALMTYAVIDEIVYVSRTAEYDYDFKGHLFEEYPRKDKFAKK
jgi:phosphatidylglycerophosphate synthase